MRGLSPEELAMATLYGHTLLHPDHVPSCPTCRLIFRAESTLNEIIDCDRMYCSFDHPVQSYEEEY